MDEFLKSTDIILPQNCDESDDSDNVTTDTSTPAFNSSEELVTDTENEDYNKQLRQRILTLKESIFELKGKLQDERELWRIEVEAKNSINLIRVDSYNNNYNRYARDYNMYENSQNLQKQIALTNYKRRLLEVENMCNLELQRVKQHAQCLQPLQNIMTGYNIAAQMGDMGDSEHILKKEQIQEEIIPTKPCNTSNSSPRLSPPNSARWNETEKCSQSQPSLPTVME